jgi:hypothetical protein
MIKNLKNLCERLKKLLEIFDEFIYREVIRR